MASLPEPLRSRAAFKQLLHTVAAGGHPALEAAADAAAQIEAEVAAADAAEAAMEAAADGVTPPPQQPLALQPGWLPAHVPMHSLQQMQQEARILLARMGSLVGGQAGGGSAVQLATSGMAPSIQEAGLTGVYSLPPWGASKQQQQQQQQQQQYQLMEEQVMQEQAQQQQQHLVQQQQQQLQQQQQHLHRYVEEDEGGEEEGGMGEMYEGQGLDWEAHAGSVMPMGSTAKRARLAHQPPGWEPGFGRAGDSGGGGATTAATAAAQLPVLSPGLRPMMGAQAAAEISAAEPFHPCLRMPTSHTPSQPEQPGHQWEPTAKRQRLQRLQQQPQQQQPPQQQKQQQQQQWPQHPGSDSVGPSLFALRTKTGQRGVRSRSVRTVPAALSVGSREGMGGAGRGGATRCLQQYGEEEEKEEEEEGEEDDMEDFDLTLRVSGGEEVRPVSLGGMGGGEGVFAGKSTGCGGGKGGWSGLGGAGQGGGGQGQGRAGNEEFPDCIDNGLRLPQAPRLYLQHGRYQGDRGRGQPLDVPLLRADRGAAAAAATAAAASRALSGPALTAAAAAVGTGGRGGSGERGGGGLGGAAGAAGGRSGGSPVDEFQVSLSQEEVGGWMCGKV